jgi:hypothetical protein
VNYGQLRLLIQKENSGADLELVDGYIQDRYTEILDFLPWKRQEGETVLQSPASYATGTITATQGSNAIVGVGTTWTAAMTGRRIRIANASEYYQFTYVSVTTATLDRGYEQPSAALLAYRIDQAVFLLPATCRILRGVKPLHNSSHPLEHMTPAELDAWAPKRTSYGTPEVYVPSFDAATDPPQLQVELYPIPDSPDTASATLSFVADCISDTAALTPGTTTQSLLPWVRPSALKAGVRANFLALAKDYTGAAFYAARMGELVGIMAKNNAMQRGPSEIRMAPEYRRGGRNMMPPNVKWQDR